MDFNLTAEQKQLYKNIVSFAQSHLNDEVQERDASETFSRDLWTQCAEEKLQGLIIPEALGGRGLSGPSAAVALEALGYGCEDNGLSFSIGAHLLSAALPLWKHGTEAQQEKYLPGLSDGSIIGCFAMNEPTSGSNAYALSTQALKTDGGFTISGEKMLISNAPVSDLFIVTAVANPDEEGQGELTGFLVERDTPGLTVEDAGSKMGLRTSPLGRVTLHNVDVSEEEIVGEVGIGFSIFNDAMNWERILLVACHVGTMQRILETCIAYTRTRVVAGKPISAHQAVAHKIANMKTQVETSRLLVYRSAARLEKARDVGLDAAMTKLHVSEAYQQVAQAAVQIHGGVGYLTENSIERMHRDAMAASIYSGTSEIQRTIIAKWLGLPVE